MPSNQPADSEISAASSDAGGLNETLADRLLALRDVIPPVQRARLGAGLTTGYRWVAAGLTLGGKSLWVLSTSAMLVGIPWALAFTEEAQMMEMEKEMKMQQSANEVRRRKPIPPSPSPLSPRPAFPSYQTRKEQLDKR